MSQIKKIKLTHWLIGSMIWLSAILMVLPFWFMLIFATHNEQTIFSVPPPLWFGDELSENIHQLLNRLPYFWYNLSNSFYIALVTTLLNLLLLHISEHSDHPFRDYTIADFAIIRSPIPRFSGQF